MFLAKTGFLFSRRIRPLLKATTQVEQTPKQDEFLDAGSFDFQKREVLTRKIKKAQEDLIYKGEDSGSTKLVDRVNKGAVWGLGGQLIQLKNKINQRGISGTVQEISDFLTLQQAKDIYVQDFQQTHSNLNRKRYSIVCSGFSSRHCYKIGKEIKNALDFGKKETEYYPIMIGRKDDEWVLVEFGDFDIHILTEQERKEADLEYKWNNPVSEQTVDKYLKTVKMGKSRRNFQPLDQD